MKPFLTPTSVLAFSQEFYVKLHNTAKTHMGPTFYPELTCIKNKLTHGHYITEGQLHLGSLVKKLSTHIGPICKCWQGNIHHLKAIRFKIKSPHLH